MEEDERKRKRGRRRRGGGGGGGGGRRTAVASAETQSVNWLIACARFLAWVQHSKPLIIISTALF